MKVRYVETENVRPAPWKATYIFRPDLKTLQKNIESVGVLYPALVRDEDSTIIDGHARWLVAQNDKELKKKFPVLYVDCTEAEAMILHVQINRARGQIIAKDLSDLINLLIDDGEFDEEEIRLAFDMSIDEFEVLVDGSLVKRKNLKEHKYNKSWVPVESKSDPAPIVVERPKTPDR